MDEEANVVVVALVQREPGDGVLAANDPFAQQRRLAKAGRRGDEGELAVEARVQRLNQARARHQVGARWRDIEFGLQEGRFHTASIL